MSQISIVDARPRFTKALIDVYRETTSPSSFLRSFFPSVITGTKELSIEVLRGKELAAVDILRGTEGNRNEFSRSSEKIFVPPYFREYFDATDLDFYDRLFASQEGMVDDLTFASWLERVMEKVAALQDKIERAYELQCAQVLLTGIVTVETGLNIDFKRKAASLVDIGGANYWDQSGSDPIADMLAGCTFVRTKGKGQGGTLNAIFGGAVLQAFLNNEKVQNQSDLKDFKLNDIRQPQRDSTGATLHGTVSVGAWNVRIWSYPEYYDTATVENIPYIDEDKFVILPEVPKFKFGFAAVPKLIRNPNNPSMPEFISQQRGDFLIGNYVDARTEKHVFDVKSAGLAIPTAVDQIYTGKVL